MMRNLVSNERDHNCLVIRAARQASFSKSETAAPSHRGNVFAVLYRQQDARTVVEAGAILFGPVVDALRRRDFVLAHEGLADRFAEFSRAGLGVLERGRNDALENLERVIGVTGELAAAVGSILGFVSGVERKAGLLGTGAVRPAFR